MIPDPTLDVSQYLFHHPGVDLIWTTGGPKAVAAANAAGKPSISVGAGNAPVYVHGSADIRMAVMDILISKTFDASVICPAEQTCVADDAIYDELVAEFERMGARLLNPEEVEALTRVAFDAEGQPEIRTVGQSCLNLGAMAGIEVGENDKVLLAPLPSDLEALADHPFVQEKLMPVLGLVRSPSVQHGIDTCVLVTEHGGLGHTSAVYTRDDDVVDRFAAAVRTGRILVNAPTAVGALGGVYNSMTPTFSLGAGTWGGSNTTDNINYRNLLNIKTVSRRQAPPQWFRVPSDTYFNAGAVENLRQVGGEQILLVTDTDTEARGVPDDLRPHFGKAGVHVFTDITPEPTEEQIRAGVAVVEQIKPDVHRRPGRRLGHGRGQGNAALLRESRAEHARTLAALPRRAQAGGPLPGQGAQGEARRGADDFGHGLRGLPGGGGHRGREEAHPGRLFAGPRHGDRRSVANALPAALDHRRHRHRCAHSRARGTRLDLCVPLHRCLLPAGHLPDPRRAPARLRGRRRISMPAPRWPTRRRSPGWPSRMRSSA